MKKTCDTCGGCGQIQHFMGGVSRFLLAAEECPACCGFGFTLEENETAQENREPGKGDPLPAMNKKKKRQG